MHNEMQNSYSLEVYNSDLHYPIINEWFKLRNLGTIDADLLPKYGLIAYNEDTPLAVLFLHKTDCKVTWLDSMISNPKADKDLRTEAIDMLYETMCSYAKSIGYKTLFAVTVIPKMKMHLKKLFLECGNNASMFIKEL